MSDASRLSIFRKSIDGYQLVGRVNTSFLPFSNPTPSQLIKELIKTNNETKPAPIETKTDAERSANNPEVERL